MSLTLMAFTSAITFVLTMCSVIIYLYSKGCASTLNLFLKKDIVAHLPLSYQQQREIKKTLNEQREWNVFIWLPVSLMAIATCSMYAIVVSVVDNPINILSIVACFSAAASVVRARACDFAGLELIGKAFLEAGLRYSIASIKEQYDQIPRIAAEMNVAEEKLRAQADEMIKMLEERIAELHTARQV